MNLQVAPLAPPGQEGWLRHQEKVAIASLTPQTGWLFKHRSFNQFHDKIRYFQQRAVLEIQHLDSLRLQICVTLGIVATSQNIVMDAALKLNSQLSFWTVKVQSVSPNSVLTAKLNPKSRVFQMVPKTLLCWCRVVTQLLPERLLVRRIVDLLHSC